MYERPSTDAKHVLQALLHQEDGLELGEEPLVDVGHLPDLLHAVSTGERSMNGENALVRRIDEFLINIFHNIVLSRCKKIVMGP